MAFKISTEMNLHHVQTQVLQQAVRHPGKDGLHGLSTIKLLNITGEMEEFIHSAFRHVCLGFTLHIWLILSGRNANKMKKDVCFHPSGESRH